MPLYIDKKYANLLAPRLPLFKWGGNGQANFRCPICGDSDKNKTKKRGYLYEYKDSLNMKCHNCGASMSFHNFLKGLDDALYRDYITDAFKYNNDHRWYEKKSKDREENVSELVVTKELEPALGVLQCVLDLPEDHICKQYVRNRKIPMKHWEDLFYVENFQTWTNKYVEKDKFKKPPFKDERMVIPFRSLKGKAFAYQGRSLTNNDLRYITINPSDSMLIYGLDRINKKRRKGQPIYTFEGPIDSMYFDDTLAAAGSSLKKLLKSNNKNLVFVYDNEPRSKEICEQMEQVINDPSEPNIVIWPKELTLKDIGNMIESGLKAEELLDIMSKSTYNGLEAKLEFLEWKRI